MMGKKRIPMRRRIVPFLIAAALVGSESVHAEQEAHVTAALVDYTSPADVDAALREMERIANEVANARSYFDQDYRPIVIRASLSPEDGSLYLDADDRLGPEAGYTDMIDMQNDIESSASELIDGLNGGNEPHWRFGGRDIGWWIDQGIADADPLSKPSITLGTLPSAVGKSTATVGPLVVAGGHGFYYNYGQKRWTSHRDLSNGMLEDDVAQAFADQLHSQLTNKRIPAVNLRRLKGGSTHAPSGLEWWKLGARYHIEATSPELVHVWNTKPNSKDLSRERTQDLRSRPLYANHTKAAALLHVHTNANRDTSATGTRVFTFPGRSEDAKLASLVLCGMSELIHSEEKFSSYNVPSTPLTSVKHGETRLAKIPAVIVEVGFHTNPSDVTYLTDRLFQFKSMAGVAKGYRLYRDGKTCAPFKIASDQAADVVVWGRGKLPIAFGGNPDFPIKLITQKLDCPTCQPMHSSVWDAAAVERTRIEHACRPEDLAHSPIRYQVSAIDAYGVKSNPVTYTFNCKPRQARKQRILRHS